MIHARVNVTYAGVNGDLVDLMDYDMNDVVIKAQVQECIVSGSIPGLENHTDADLTDFVVDRFPASGDLPARLFVRPKTPFGG